MNREQFTHSGDLGDIIFSLPAIKHAGGGDLLLFDCYPKKTVHPMTPARVNAIRPLLLAQDYLYSVAFAPTAPDHPLNQFRERTKTGNLAERHLRSVGLPDELCQEAWLTLPGRRRIAPVLFARSARYRNKDFPWRKVYDKYRSLAVFVGLHEEYLDFKNTIGPLPFYPTRDLLELATVISGSDLIVANQSAPAAIAEGLKHTMVLEVSKFLCADSCIFNRVNLFLGYDDSVHLPEVPLNPIHRLFFKFQQPRLAIRSAIVSHIL